MFNLNQLRPSTRMYLIGLIFSLLGLVRFNTESLGPITPLTRFLAMADVIFSLMAVASILALCIGVYRSIKEIKTERAKRKELIEKRWYRFSEIFGYVLYFLVLFLILGSDWSRNFIFKSDDRFFFLVVFVYIFCARLVKKAFLYIIFGEHVQCKTF